MQQIASYASDSSDSCHAAEGHVRQNNAVTGKRGAITEQYSYMAPKRQKADFPTPLVPSDEL